MDLPKLVLDRSTAGDREKRPINEEGRQSRDLDLSTDPGRERGRERSLSFGHSAFFVRPQLAARRYSETRTRGYRSQVIGKRLES